MNSSAIIYLFNNNSKDIKNFRESISLLINNYYKYFPCDIICFYENDFPKSELQFLKEQLYDIKIYFHLIELNLPNYPKEILDQIPEYFPHPDFPSAPGFSLGYRHMCRFFAGTIFNNKKLLPYKYVWRLDTDSFILNKITYNVFDRLSETNSIYGYINIQHDHPGVIKELWNNSKNYFSNLIHNNIFDPPNNEFHKNRVFYTNFEIFDMEWFRGPKYQSYFQFLDSLAGIYKYRWGDHSIRYIGVNALIDPEQIYFYSDIHYFHQQEYLNTRILDNLYGN